MTVHAWALFLGAVFLLSGTPGPNMLHVMTRSLRFGFGASTFAMAGCLSAVVLVLCASAMGLGALLAASPDLFAGLRYAGVAYLIGLGIQSWRGAEAGPAITAEPRAPSPPELFRGGFLIGVSNPKLLLFAAAFLPQFVDPAAESRPATRDPGRHLRRGRSVLVRDLCARRAAPRASPRTSPRSGVCSTGPPARSSSASGWGCSPAARERRSVSRRRARSVMGLSMSDNPTTPSADEPVRGPDPTQTASSQQPASEPSRPEPWSPATDANVRSAADEAPRERVARDRPKDRHANERPAKDKALKDKVPKETATKERGGEAPLRRRPAASEPRPAEALAAEPIPTDPAVPALPELPAAEAPGVPEAAAPAVPETFEGERIAKAIARAGIASRRDVEAMIAEGRVTLNGRVLDTPAINVTEADAITVDGEPLPTRERTRLWIFHKPRGLVTTARDPEGRQTVFEAMPEDMPRVVAIGRLDINTEGLLLLTNDGGLAKVIAHPDTGWLRRYRVRAFGDITQMELDQLRKGVTIDGMEYGPVEADLDRASGRQRLADARPARGQEPRGQAHPRASRPLGEPADPALLRSVPARRPRGRADGRDPHQGPEGAARQDPRRAGRRRFREPGARADRALRQPEEGRTGRAAAPRGGAPRPCIGRRPSSGSSGGARPRARPEAWAQGPRRSVWRADEAARPGGLPAREGAAPRRRPEGRAGRRRGEPRARARRRDQHR